MGGMIQAEASSLLQSPLSVSHLQATERLGDVLPTVPQLEVSPPLPVEHLLQPPSLSHRLAARRISSMETVLMRKCQGTQATVCISFPGMTSAFPRSTQTHKHPGSKQWPVSSKQPTDSLGEGFYPLPGFRRGLCAVPLPTGKWLMLRFSGVTWGSLFP